MTASIRMSYLARCPFFPCWFSRACPTDQNQVPRLVHEVGGRQLSMSVFLGDYSESHTKSLPCLNRQAFMVKTTENHPLARTIDHRFSHK
jgi:hypothetical protein